MTGRFTLGWMQVAICFVFLACDSMITSAYSLVAVPLEQEFHTSRMVLMLANTVMALGSAILAPILGAMLDRKPLRVMMGIGGFLLSAGYAALSLTTAFWQVLVIFAVIVAPANVLTGPLPATVLLSRWFVAKRGLAVGLAIAGVATGTMVFGKLIAVLFAAYPWRQGLQLLGLILLVVTLVPAMFVVNRPEVRGLHPDGASEGSAAANIHAARSDVSAGEVLSDPAFWGVAIIFASVLSGMAGMITNMAPLAIGEGVSKESAATLVLLYGLGGLTAKVCFAFVADRVGPRVLMFASLIGFATGMTCLTQAHYGFWPIAIGASLVGFFGGYMVPLQSIIVPRIFGERVVGKALGLLSTVTLIPLLLSPPSLGRVHDVAGSYAPAFAFYALLAVAVLFLVPHVRLHPRDEVSLAPAE